MPAPRVSSVRLSSISPAQGSAVVVVSQDLDELFEVADRMAVIHQGHLSPLRPIGEWTKEAVGLEMLGVAQASGGVHAV